MNSLPVAAAPVDTAHEQPLMQTLISTLRSLSLVEASATEEADLVSQVSRSVSALKSQVSDLQASIATQARQRAESLVDAAVHAGRLPAKDTDARGFWVDALIRDEAKAVKALDALAVNPVLARISEFTNPSGEIVFRVTCWLDGKRIRKNFPTRADAVAKRQTCSQTLDIQRGQSGTGVRTAATQLTDEQLHEAEAAFRRLADAPKSLSFYLDYALANYRAPEREIAVAAAVETYPEFRSWAARFSMGQSRVRCRRPYPIMT